MLVGTLIVQKFYNDKYYGNNTISLLGGVSIQELNMLEEEFLEMIDFDLCVSNEEITETQKKLQAFKINNND
jgi:PHO85 cyclin-6/7